jgi:hypothetical protein
MVRNTTNETKQASAHAQGLRAWEFLSAGQRHAIVQFCALADADVAKAVLKV